MNHFRVHHGFNQKKQCLHGHCIHNWKLRYPPDIRLVRGMGKKESDTVKDSLQSGGRPSASKVLHYWRQHLTHPRFSTHQDLCMEAALAPLTKWYSLLLGHSLSDVGFVCHADMQNTQILKNVDVGPSNQGKYVLICFPFLLTGGFSPLFNISTISTTRFGVTSS